MKKTSFTQNINLKNIIIAFISLSIIVYSSFLIINTINNGIKRYNLIENEQDKLDKLKQENQNLNNQLSQTNDFDKQTQAAMINFNLVDPEARIYVVQIPQEIKYLDVKAEIENYNPVEEQKSGLEKFLHDLFGKNN